MTHFVSKYSKDYYNVYYRCSMNGETGCPATTIINEIEESCDPETGMKKFRLIWLKRMLLINYQKFIMILCTHMRRSLTMTAFEMRLFSVWEQRNRDLNIWIERGGNCWVILQKNGMT